MPNPLEVIYCWQSVLAACAIVSFTQTAKTLVDVIWGHVDPEYTPTVTDKARVGKVRREASPFVNRFLLPAMPILVGMTYALLVPAWPEPVRLYVTHIESWRAYLIYASWGAACGQFSSYIYDKLRESLLSTAAAVLRRMAPPAPAVPPQHAPTIHTTEEVEVPGDGQ